MPGDRSAAFALISGVTLEGGYAGCGAEDPDERDLEAHETILDGDLNGDDDLPVRTSDCCHANTTGGCEDETCTEEICDFDDFCCVIEWDEECANRARFFCCELCSEKRNCENSFHVLIDNGADASAVLDGFTITSGRADDVAVYSRRGGAGLHIDVGSPTVRHCHFTKGAAVHGGAISIGPMSCPVIENCRFTHNRSGNVGGAITDSAECGTIIRNCDFVHNAAEGPFGPGGGAIYTSGNGSIINCRFFGNWTSRTTYVASGGAILAAYYNHPSIINCLFSGNWASGSGGAVFSDGPTTVTNCSFVGNYTTHPEDEGGGLSANQAPTITNSVFWGNSNGTVGGETSQLQSWAPPIINHSIIEGWTGALGGVGNHGNNPLLIDPDGADGAVGTSDDDLRVKPDSPAIDAGNSDADTHSQTQGQQSLPALDVAQNPRFIEIADAPNVGLSQRPGIPVVDIGALEHLTDCNGNGVTDAIEISSERSHDCNANSIPDECEPDCNANDIADGCDITNGKSDDCTANGFPDECELDCNGNSVADVCDIAFGDSADTNDNGIPDKCEAAILFVNDDAMEGGDGLTWATAFNNLQEALAVAVFSGGTIKEIWVAAGTYMPGTSRSNAFVLLSGVDLYGGFAGTETGGAQRDPAANPTILSGDLNGDDSGEPDDPSRAENSERIVVAYEIESTVILDGFTITAAHNTSFGYYGGGGLRFAGSDVAVRNCLVASNQARQGAGAFVRDSTVLFENCVFENNAGTSFSSSGGGLYSVDSHVTLRGCVFQNNVAGYAGGGVLGANSQITLTDCLVAQNAVENFGSGGGLYNGGGTMTLNRCTIENNRADQRGGGFSGSGLVMFNGIVRGNSATDSYSNGGGLYLSGTSSITGVLFEHNTSMRNGGAMVLGGANVSVTNCTFRGNSAVQKGGGAYASVPATLNNCILWGNTAGSGSTEAKQIFSTVGSPNLDYSCIQGWSGAWGGTGNIGTDPRFVADDDSRLASGSPCIDAADNGADTDSLEPGTQSIPVTDLDGHPRFVEIFDVPNSGHGTPPIIDMGAFEHVLECNGNDVSDDLDISSGFSGDCNLNTIPDECEADCNANGVADSCDISEGTSNDANANGVADECEADCNLNGIPDDHDLSVGSSVDCNLNAVPDDCEADCNGTDVPDDCDVSSGTSADCNGNGSPDECDVMDGTSADCTDNGLPDECEPDCNGNLLADSCDLQSGISADCTDNGVPDECEPDCNGNAIADPCETAAGMTPDENGNAVPDECEPSILFVDRLAVAGGNGTSWSKAFRSLQGALSVAGASLGSVTEIRIAEGMYTPGAESTATFALVSGVAVKGGYAGIKHPIPNIRDPATHITILSGDLNGNDGPDFTNRADNAYHVVSALGTNPSTSLDGVTVVGGWAVQQYDHDEGGGIKVENGVLTLRNCVLKDNAAKRSGGGLYGAYGSNLIVDGCRFERNAISGSAGEGAGASVAAATFHRCAFIENSTSGGSSDAGGLAADSSLLVDCLFWGNDASGSAGGALLAGATALNCVFSGNSAEHDGGGVVAVGGLSFFSNCLFVANSAGDDGGGLLNYFSSFSELNNCTFSGNSAGRDGGGIFVYDDYTLLDNSILWNNSDSGPQDESAQLFVEARALINYSCVQGWTGMFGGTGNFGADPEFADPDGSDNLLGTSDDSFQLVSTSPCINTGDPAYVPQSAETDLGGHARLICGRVDLGAFEFGAGDTDCDRCVESDDDYVGWVDCLSGPDPLEIAPGCTVYDLDADSDVDMLDFLIFQGAVDTCM